MHRAFAGLKPDDVRRRKSNRAVEAPVSIVSTTEGSPSDGEPADPDRLWSTRDVARYLGLDELTVYRMRQRGDGPVYVKLGSARRSVVRYRMRDVVAWVESHTRTSSGPETGEGVAR